MSVCKSTRYGPGCGHPTGDHDQNPARECCCCTGRHNDPHHVQGCLDCAVLHAKRWAGPGATNGEVAKHIPPPLRGEFWRGAIERYVNANGLGVE